MLALRILDSPSMVMPVPSNSPTIQSMLVGDAPRSQREREPAICTHVDSMLVCRIVRPYLAVLCQRAAGLLVLGITVIRG